MKGVILAGGTGSRLHPLTKIYNKHLLPIGPYPMIYWPILKLKEAGVDEIILVTNKRDLSKFIELLGLGEELNVKLHYVIQDAKGAGIADALLSAKPLMNDEKMIVLLGDNIFEDSLENYIEGFKKQNTGAKILLKQVKDPTRYGVPRLDEKNKRILSILEKPTTPPSSYCVTGIYMYDHKVFDYVEKINPSDRNELEITDVNNIYIYENQLQYDILNGWWIDAGTHDSLFKATKSIFEHLKKSDGNG